MNGVFKAFFDRVLWGRFLAPTSFVYQLHIPTRLFLSLIVLFAFTAEDSAAKHSKKEVAQLMQQMMSVQLAARAADDAIFAQAQKVALSFQKLCQQVGRLPYTGSETQRACRMLTDRTFQNPYLSDSSLAQEANRYPRDGEGYPISIVLDPYEVQSARYLLGTPPDSWKGCPGDIVIVHDAYRNFLVFGVGIDGRPILNDQKLPRIVKGCFQPQSRSITTAADLN